MARSYPFGLFILALCLVDCVCANAVGSVNDAQNSLTKAKKFTDNLLNTLKKKVIDAEDLQKEIDKQKEYAEQEAAAAEKEVNVNTTVKAIAQKAREASNKVSQLHPNASIAAQKIVDNMKELHTNALWLYRNATALSVSAEPNTNYTKIQEDADAIKSQADSLKNEMTTAKPSYDAARAQKLFMSKFVSDARIAKYQVDIIVILAKIDTLLESADSAIKLTEQTRDEISVTEHQMKNLDDKKPYDLRFFFSSLYLSVQGYLKSASRNVDEAKETKKDMLEETERVNSYLVNVQTANNYVNAYEEVRNAQFAFKNAENILKNANNALQSAKTSAINAVYLKKSAERELNERAKKQDATQENKEKNPPDSENTHQPVKSTTEIPVDSGAEQITITAMNKSTDKEFVKKTTDKSAESEIKQDTITIPVKPVSVKPKEDSKENNTGIEEKKPIITTQDQPVGEQHVDEPTESPERNETEKPTMTNSEHPVSEGTEPTQPSSSDGAMTVSVPLLLAMVACAALH